MSKFSAWPCEKEKLSEFIKSTPGKYVCEIGCYLGMTTRSMAATCACVGKTLVAIDPWDNRQDGADESIYKQFLNNINNFADVIQIVRSPSLEAVLPTDFAGNCGLVFIDGQHTYPNCMLDMQKYYSLLIKGGVLAVHDTFCPGWDVHVMRGFNDFCNTLIPCVVNHMVYWPTKSECALYNHNKTGLSWVVK